MFESKKRAFIFLIVSILFALAAVFLFSSYVETMEQDLGELVEIQVAGAAIPAGTLITPDMLKTMRLPRKYAVDSFVTSPDEAAGKISLVQIPQDEVLSKAMLREMSKTPSDYRLVQLRAPMAVFDDQIDVLDKVDVIGTYEKKAGKESGFDDLTVDDLSTDPVGRSAGDTRTTELVMRDISVIRVYKQEEEIVSIGVALTLEQARQVVWLQNFGKEVRVLKANTHLPQDGRDQ
ncbi:SAF domain-containing protein [Brevibacillus humidisoli]|uniref:Flp pilus assembly protein CpaB n=1 Tax=Brevibacillus humidisoli TaxID=2895522 RepID=UPI001E576969|nr:SAF domain-containing protein [Brevibacillus humidisoli]UFJ40794.1 SAF domain-containing protein [Brevibacillus humidisoli]